MLSNGFYTEEVCRSLEALSPIDAIRAIHQAYLQLKALNENLDCSPYDNGGALGALRECLKEAGHIGFID
jgi:hypothetical protein